MCLWYFGCYSTVSAEAADAGDGGSSNTCASGHKWGNWGASTATCTSAGTKSRSCTVCGAGDSQNVGKLGHTGGSYSGHYTSTQHYKYCTRCGGAYDYEGHNSSDKSIISGNNSVHNTYCSDCGRFMGTENHSKGSVYAANNGSVATHYKDCTACGKTKVESSTTNHDTDKLLKETEANKKGIQYDDNKHTRCCSICWRDLEQVENKEEELHTWNGSSDADNAHTCVSPNGGCGRLHSVYPHHFYGIDEGEELAGTGMKCMLRGGEKWGGNSCDHYIRVKKPIEFSGLEVTEYVCSDAEGLEMPPVPEFAPGVYEFEITGGTIRGSDGKTILKNIKMPKSWVQLTPWGQKTIATHALGTEDYRVENHKLYEQKLNDAHNFGAYYDYDIIMGLNYYGYEKLVTGEVNQISNQKAGDWPPIFKTIGTLLEIITLGAPYVPEEMDNGSDYYDESAHKFTLTYDHGNGGWMFLLSPLMNKGTDYLFTELFRYGDYDKEPEIPWEANIYYCYRLVGGAVPKNGYSPWYTHSSVIVYKSKAMTKTVNVSPDMNLIDRTGYRYVGHAIDIGEAGEVSAKSNYTSTGTSAKVTVSWKYDEAAAMVTFFVEPVELQYGHKWRDMSGKNLPDQILDVPELSCVSSKHPTPLQFPDYYDSAAKRCIIPVKSLNKFVWPGFMLKGAEVEPIGSSGSTIWKKEYDDSTTTVYSPDSGADMLQIEEDTYSHYKKNNPAGTVGNGEEAGKAKDKQFWFIYNTPQIEVEHRYYEDDGGGYVLDTSGNPIKGVEQILHQWAKVESLQTDNIGLPHTIGIGTSTFEYACPNLDLVQLEVYEVSNGGTESYKGTLYSDNKYDPGNGGKKLTGYSGVFEDYYMDTYSNLKAQFNNNDLFNTNKNWKLVFRYVSVEKVHIRFYDLKGNIIFTKNENGKYVSEITDLIHKVNGYTHTITDLGKFTPVAYTIEKDAYNKNLSESSEINGITGNYNPPTIPVPPRDGDRYIIIFYSTEDTLRVDYRDTDNNSIQVPPNYVSTVTLEIPDTGAFVDVPVVSGYIVKEYRINTEYDGTSNDIPGPGTAIPNAPTQISVPSSGQNQFVIVYYEKIEAPTKVIVEYRSGDVTGIEIKDSVEIPLETGVDTNISVPAIEGFSPAYYVKNDDPTQNLPYDIVVVGDPSIGNQKIIIVYTSSSLSENSPGEPGVITPEDNKEFVELKANKTTANEYNVETSIPTSEDLYVSGDVYSYKFIEDVEEIASGEKINVIVRQEYYTKLDGANSTTAFESTDPFEVVLDYSYYQVNKAELYDLKNLELENDAIKYYKGYDTAAGTYTDYMEGKAVLDVTKDIPKIVYSEPSKIVEIKNGSTVVGSLTKEGSNYVITLNDIAYVRPTDLEDRYNSENLSEVLAVFGELTTIHLQKLIITMPGQSETDGVVILTGGKYQLNQKTEALKEGVNYLPYTPGRAPLYTFLEDKGLYVQESALNQTYQTKMTGIYKMIEAVVSGDSSGYTPTSMRGDVGIFDPATKEHARNPIAVNQLSIHTPIINKAVLKVPDEHKKTIQLINAGVAGANTEIITLDEKFTIEIPNSGAHKTDKGYGTKLYNHNGLSKDDTSKLIKDKSGALDSKVITQEMYAAETEELSIGPSFAEYKLIKFPYDVYLVSGESGDVKNILPKKVIEGTQKETSVLLKANTWYNLYEYLSPAVTKYTFVIPVWVKDAHKYEGENGIHVLVVAENCDAATLNSAKTSPTSITKDDANLNRNHYILRKSFDTYVSGRVYDLQVRDTDDAGFMNKLPKALSGDKTSETTEKELPLAQKGQVAAYNMGMKLGYRFYFDLKTKGITNKTVNIKPKVYYVATDGTVNENIALFYHSKGNLYNKLNINDLTVKMTMAGTHGIVNNAGYTTETIAAKQITPSRVFTNIVNIGKINEGLALQRETEKLPYDNILESAKAYGFGEDKASFVNSAKESTYIAASGENGIKNATGHWYGEYYLPASTIVVPEAVGTTVTKQNIISGAVNPYTTGYLVVVFENITTVEDDPEADYLTYSMPAESQWKKEGIETKIVLPNGTQTAITSVDAGAMAIYQVGLRANNDYETEGTH